MRARHAALALLLLLPLAAGDHVYSHRYVFEGRLVDAEGLPIPGRTMEFFTEGQDFLEPCSEPQRATTDQWGDFRFCFHVHEVRASAMVGVRSGDVAARKPMDTGLRRTIVTLTDPAGQGVAPEGWNETFRIAGRVWREGPTVLEGVSVFGLALPDVPVNLTLTTPDGNGTELRLVTDATGDFDATIRLVNGTRAEDVLVEAQALGEVRELRLSARFHRSTVGFLLPSEHPAPAAVVARAGGASLPGESTPPLGIGLALATLAAVALTVGYAHWKLRP